MIPCGAWGGCTLPRGHNMGKVDVPENHNTGGNYMNEYDALELESSYRRANPNSLSYRIARLEEQKAELERQQAFLDQLPKEPAMKDEVTDGEEGVDLVPVVYFKKQFEGSDKVYDYVVLRARDGLWYTTGPRTPKGYSWHELLLWLMETSPDHQLPEIKVSYVEDWSVLHGGS